jgi:formylmethanofuran dehydrogenase subunit E
MAEEARAIAPVPVLWYRANQESYGVEITMQGLPTIEDAERFHGHMCPGLALGYRVAVEAMEALGCARAGDEELVAVVENDSCAVDAIQVVCSCTFGKGNLIFRDHGKHVYTLHDRKRGRGVRVSVEWPGHEQDPEFDRLREAVSTGEGSPEQKEAFWAKMRERAQAVLEAPASTFLTIEAAAEPPPPKARIERSERCEECGEPTMVSRLVEVNGRRLCRSCAAEGRGR